MHTLSFSISEVLALIGFANCLYIIVYVALRAQKISRAGVPLLYFMLLSGALLFDFAENEIAEFFPYYNTLQLFLWFSSISVSVLLLLQVAYITKPVPRAYFILPFLLLFAYMLNFFMVEKVFTGVGLLFYTNMNVVIGIIASATSLLLIWAKRHLFETVLAHKFGRERYWLMLAIIIMNVGLLIIMISSLDPDFKDEDLALSRAILGIGFIYLVTTCLFRLYPQTLRVQTAGGGWTDADLSDDELSLALEIEELFNLQKVYQEPGYSRADLAKECQASEAQISKVINIYFKKSYPQLANEYRVSDAKRLLIETDAPVNVIAEESGFSSLVSFNRVFKNITGHTPSRYRGRGARIQID